MLIRENESRSSAEIQREIARLEEIQEIEYHTYDQMSLRTDKMNPEDPNYDKEMENIQSLVDKMVKSKDTLIHMREDLKEKQKHESQQHPSNLVHRIENLVRTQEQNDQIILTLLDELKRRITAH